MDRREFVATGVGGALGLRSLDLEGRGASPAQVQVSGVRALFPRLTEETFLNAAGGTPLGSFAEEGIRRYLDYIRMGPAEGRSEYVGQMRAEVRDLFARLIGAKPAEVGLVHCTKAGEQIVLDSLEALRGGGNVVTNDMHFGGSLHNLVGLSARGLDVRIVPAVDFDVSLERMADTMDDRTALVAVASVSNVNGRVEPMAELSHLAHDRGALVYADIIQAAGAVPMDVEDLGIDFAACSAYKWLFGVHGVGFLYVKEDLQGTALPDHLFPGHAVRNYAPWVEEPDPQEEDFLFRPREDATRYQHGHVSYLGYCAAYEGLKFIHERGVETLHAHSVALVERLVEQLDPDRFRCITPDPGATPIVSFEVADPDATIRRLQSAGAVVAVGGYHPASTTRRPTSTASWRRSPTESILTRHAISRSSGPCRRNSFRRPERP
ncbi:MAG: aminotransferase class V-fold PLP-dependent enzyme [Gemmatimonadota bacterium]